MKAPNPFVPKKKAPKSQVSDSSPKAKKRPKVVEDDNLGDGEEEDNETSEPSLPKNRMALALAGNSKPNRTYVVQEMLPEDEGVEKEKRWENKRTNSALVAVPAKLSVSSSQDLVKGMATVFGQRGQLIMDMLEDDANTDGALILIQRTLLQTMVDILPVAERAVRASSGRHGFMSFNQTVNSVRELTAEIQSLRDRGQLGASIVEKVLRPAYLDLASQVSVAFMEIANQSKVHMKEDAWQRFHDDTLMSLKRNLAAFILGQYEQVKSSVIKNMS